MVCRIRVSPPGPSNLRYRKRVRVIPLLNKQTRSINRVPNLSSLRTCASQVEAELRMSTESGSILLMYSALKFSHWLFRFRNGLCSRRRCFPGSQSREPTRVCFGSYRNLVHQVCRPLQVNPEAARMAAWPVAP